MNSNPTLLVVCGPTAVGKTALAIELAQHFQTEIISADSRQFFKEMSIGTAKPDAQELAAAPHHFINSHSIEEDINAGIFEKEALKLLEELFKKQSIVIAVGGSGLYINALCQGMDDLPDKDEKLRAQLQKNLEEKGIQSLQEQLKTLDSAYYEQVDRNNPQRLMRAIEVCLSTGKSYSSLRLEQKQKRPFKIIKIGLDLPREQLYRQINHRVELMLAAGLVEEVKALYPQRQLNALQTVGYSEIFDHIDGKCSLQEAIAAIQQNTRRFAKRQLTWFRKDSEITWFSPKDTPAVLAYIKKEMQA